MNSIVKKIVRLVEGQKIKGHFIDFLERRGDVKINSRSVNDLVTQVLAFLEDEIITLQELVLFVEEFENNGNMKVFFYELNEEDKEKIGEYIEQKGGETKLENGVASFVDIEDIGENEQLSFWERNKAKAILKFVRKKEHRIVIEPGKYEKNNTNDTTFTKIWGIEKIRGVDIYIIDFKNNIIEHRVTLIGNLEDYTYESSILNFQRRFLDLGIVVKRIKISEVIEDLYKMAEKNEIELKKHVYVDNYNCSHQHRTGGGGGDETLTKNKDYKPSLGDILINKKIAFEFLLKNFSTDISQNCTFILEGDNTDTSKQVDKHSTNSLTFNARYDEKTITFIKNFLFTICNKKNSEK